MSLDALAPDQRAVVQLVLQQDRSYDELAELLGISTSAVRERAHRGLERLAPAGGVDAGDRAEIADYLLGQQSVSGRERTRERLAGSGPARAWALAVAAELRDVARGPLPEVPEAAATTRTRPEPEPGPPSAAPETTETAERPVRARPRPRPDRSRTARERDQAAAVAPGAASKPATARLPEAAEGDDSSAGSARARDRAARPDRPRTSRLGGAVLIAGLAVLLVAAIVFVVARGGEDEPSRADRTATPTATAEPEFQALGQIPLTSPDGGDAEGQMVIFAGRDGSVAFTIQGKNVPRSQEGEAYAVWLLGGNRPRRLGYAPPVGANGELGTSGPQAEDQDRFAQWFARADRVAVSRESTDDATEPGPIVLEGEIPQDAGQGQGGG